MSGAALALVLAAALLHALWNVVAKKTGGDARFAFMAAFFLVVVWAPLGARVGWQALPRWGAIEWAALLASAVLHVVYFTTLLRGYRLADLTVVYPMARGTGPVLASLGALAWLGERLSAVAAVGLALVAVGVFFIAGGPTLWSKAHDPAHRARVRAGLLWGGLTGALIAAYTLVDGYAVKVLLLSPILVDYVGNLLRVPFLLPAALRDRGSFVELWRAQWRAALVVAVLGPLAYVLVLYAMQLAPVSHVAPAREVSMLFAALIGGRLLGEVDRAARLLGAACIAAGVAALALG
jgi:drug/metabolite transporter (DMT)-like permease